MTVGLVAVGVFCAVGSLRRRPVALGVFLGEHRPPTRRHLSRIAPRSLIVGAASGVVVAVTAGAAVLPMGITGGLAGALLQRAARSTRRQRRAARLVQELPTAADTLALHVLAGESVATAIHRFASVAQGVVAEELAVVRASATEGLTEALRRASEATVHPEAARLYDLLGHAHRAGGRLAEALTDLAVDYRAALARDLTAEGGRRALAVYGPILALMIPVTLLFLMYPTLAGLSALSSTP
jgi:tight adherence protein C